MIAKPTPQAQALTAVIADLYRIEALAYAIERMTDELHVFSSSSCAPVVEGLTKDVSNSVHHLASLLREMAMRTQDFLLDAEKY